MANKPKATVNEKAAAEAVAQSSEVSTAAVDPEIAAKIAAVRSHIRESFGKVAMAMMMLPRYRNQTLHEPLRGLALASM